MRPVAIAGFAFIRVNCVARLMFFKEHHRVGDEEE